MNGRAHHGVRDRARGAGCALACLWFAGSPLHALDPASTIAQYAHSLWSRENGQLPANVTALTQTGDGNLWVGTDSGLLRFDGVRFQPWRPPNQQLVSEYILALASARDGSLWIGTREGLSHWDHTRVHNYQTSTGSAGPRVVAIRVDTAGTVWAATAGYRSGGLCRVEASGLRCYGAADGLPGFSALSLFADRQGSLWVGHLGLCKWEPGCSHVYAMPDHGEIHAIAEDPQRGLWIAGRGLKRLSDGQFIPYPLPGASNDPQIRALLSDRNGGLWIGTLGQGLLRIYQGRIDRFTHQDGLSNDNVRCLQEDAEGNIWVGTDGGLDRFREYAVTTILKREGGLQSAVGSVFASKDGGVWIGTTGGLRYLRDGKTVAYDQHQGLPSGDIMGIFEEQSGRVWTFTNAGLAYSERTAAERRFRPVSLSSGQKISFAAAVEDRDHSVWLSDPDHGLIRLKDAHVAGIVPWSQFGNKQAWALASDPGNGDLWLGFRQGGIACYKQGQIHWYATPGLPERAAVMDLHLAPDGSLWIATQGGLSRLHRGRVVPLTVAGGLPPDGIRAMVEDDQGALWLNMACGLVRISGDDLSRWSANPAAKIHPKIFTAGDGMHMGHTATGYFRRAAKSNDGRLWFAVFEGVAVVNPNRLPENRRPPPVQIEGMMAGQTAYSISQRLRLPPLTKEVRIDYTAMSFVNPDRVRFRYRLDGFDKEWHDVTTTREAVYTNLPPRNYRFRVIACNNDGVWNESGAWCDFWIEPAYYQTIWFRFACLAAFAIALWSLHRLRLQRMGARLSAQMNARFEERLAERTRIAREMHDTLLQNLCGVALQLKGLAKIGTLAPLVKDRLEEICQHAEACSRQAREFVWDLRAPTLEENDLSQTLRQAGEEIIVGQPVQFRVTVKGTPHPAPVELQQHLLRIVQEATRNAVRYSRAQEIGMHIAYLEPDLIRVRMRDDGCGFDPEKASRETGHWGLITMRERAKQMGAELKISSAPGRGTEIEILVACTPA